MRTYDIATEFQHEFSNQENDFKWHLYGSPQRVMQVIEEQVQTLEKEKERFLKEMELEQEEFQENLTNLAGTVEGFASYDKMEKYLENAEAVESINQRLQECIEKSRIYNQREYLVGKETTDYSQLQQIAKDFLPYSNLWLTTRTWHERHKEWTEGKWEDLDPDELDNTFEHCMKTINQAARYFKEREFPKITENARIMKE